MIDFYTTTAPRSPIKSLKFREAAKALTDTQPDAKRVLEQGTANGGMNRSNVTGKYALLHAKNLHLLLKKPLLPKSKHNSLKISHYVKKW